MFLRRFFLLLPLALFAACGLAEDPRNDDDKHIYIQDRITDPIFRAFCLASYDQDNDGRLSRYEARRILDMSCPGLGIASLQGIAEFGRLRQLDCSNNELTVLDLSANRELVQLNCRANKLSVLYIEELSSLSRLDCSRNVLTSLTLPATGILDSILVGDNDLVSLDISHCASNILQLDTRGNPRLTVIYKSAAQRIASLQIDGHTTLEIR